MPNTLYIPRLNPIKYVPVDAAEIPQYQTKHMDDFHFEETIQPWEEPVSYYQPWQTTDSIRQQFVSSYGPIRLSVIDKDGRVYYDGNFQQMQENFYEPGTFIYQSDVALNAFDPGLYWFKLTVGSTTPKYFLSNPQFICETQPNTVLLEYKNYRYFDGVIFETGFSPSLRVHATLRFKTPASKDTFYEDQVLNMNLLNSKPYRLWELVIGGSRGIPDYLIDKIARALGCSSLSIDGRLYTKQEGAKLEPKAEENYPMRAWSCELREKLNRGAMVYENENTVSGTIAVVMNTDSKGFGRDDSGGSIYQILDID